MTQSALKLRFSDALSPNCELVNNSSFAHRSEGTLGATRPSKEVGRQVPRKTNHACVWASGCAAENTAAWRCAVQLFSLRVPCAVRHLGDCAVPRAMCFVVSIYGLLPGRTAPGSSPSMHRAVDAPNIPLRSSSSSPCNDSSQAEIIRTLATGRSSVFRPEVENGAIAGKTLAPPTLLFLSPVLAANAENS